MLLFCDSFSHYVTADLTDKYNTVTSMTISSNNGRNNNNSLRYVGNNIPVDAIKYVSKNVTATGTFILGVAFKINSAPTNKFQLFALFDAGTTQVDLRLNTDLTLSVTRNGTVLGTTTHALATSRWYHIEWKIKITNSTSSGECVLKINETERLNLSGVDTQNTSNSTANAVILGHSPTVETGSSFTADFSDFYICDTSGSLNNDFIGDHKVTSYYPNGNGNTNQLTNQAGNSTNNYQSVDEASPNDDTDYVESSTAGQKDTYGFQDTSSSASIKGIQININARKSDAGSRSIAPVIRSNGTDYDLTTVSISDSYAFYTEIKETDPATSVAWTASGFNSAEFGIKLIS